MDLAVDVYAENLHRSSAQLTVFPEPYLGGLRTRNKGRKELCSQDYLKADDSTAALENDYTDVSLQISGVTSAEHAVKITGDGCFSTNKNEGFSRQKGNNHVALISSNQNEEISPKKDTSDVVVLISSNQREEFSRQEDNDGHVSDRSWGDYGDSDGLKRSASATSIDDAGYYSSAAPANYVDSDSQSTASHCGVSIGLASEEESLDSFTENEKFIDEAFCGSSEGLELVGMLHGEDDGTVWRH
jgi:hypothetical protein